MPHLRAAHAGWGLAEVTREQGSASAQAGHWGGLEGSREKQRLSRSLETSTTWKAPFEGQEVKGRRPVGDHGQIPKGYSTQPPESVSPRSGRPAWASSSTQPSSCSR